jgi:hypothetical protein
MFALGLVFQIVEIWFCDKTFFIEVTSGKVNLSIKIPPPVGESRFPVLAGVRRVATSLSRRVLLKGGFGAAGCGLKERHRRVSLNVLAIFLLVGGCGLKPQN